MRIFFSAIKKENGLPFGNIPKPDALIATNNQCDTLIIAWKIFAKQYNVPLFIIDFPPSKKKENGCKKKYVEQQLINLIEFMEKITNQSYDKIELDRRVKNSAKTSRLWNEVLDFLFSGRMKINIDFVTNNLFFPVVCMHSDAKTVLFLENVKNHFIDPSEMHDNYKKIYWFGYPLWFSKTKFPDLRSYNGKIVANNYLKWWNIEIDDKKQPISSLAQAYSDTYLNRFLHRKMNQLFIEIDKYDIDGVIVHSNYSCKRDSISSKLVIEKLISKNIPTVEIQSDMCDKNKFQEKQFYLRIETFLENL